MSEQRQDMGGKGRNNKTISSNSQVAGLLLMKFAYNQLTDKNDIHGRLVMEKCLTYLCKKVDVSLN